MGRRKRKSDSDAGPTTTRGGSLAQVQLNASMGVPNLGRTFKVDQDYNTPQICVHTFDSMYKHSWSSGVRADQDYDAAIDTALTYNATLNPITPIATAFVERHWPLLQSLLQSGTGSRYPTTMAEVVRYFSLTMDVLEDILFPLQLNFMTSGLDWNQIPPFDSTVPPAIWSLAELFDANDIGVADVWKPIYDRVKTKVLPPRLAAQIFESSFPYVNHISGHCVNVNASRKASAIISSWSLGNYIVDILDKLDYLENDLIMCHNTLSSFLPWVVGNPMAMFKGYDPIYEEVDYNGTLYECAPFGDTGDPSEPNALVCGSATSNGDVITYFHKGMAPQVKSVLLTPIWEVISGTDDEFVCITHSSGGPRHLIDDDLNLISYTSAAISSATAQRYRKYVPNRFQWVTGGTHLDFGASKAGFGAAIIAKEEIVRLSQRYASYLFGDDQMAKVLQYTGGASVRTIREMVMNLWLSA